MAARSSFLCTRAIRPFFLEHTTAAQTHQGKHRLYGEKNTQKDHIAVQRIGHHDVWPLILLVQTLNLLCCYLTG